MNKRAKQVGLILVVGFAAAQLVRPDRTNPPTDPSHTIQAKMANDNVGAVLDRACHDCHSNTTVWPWYTKVAPLSWVMASAVTKGRSAVNYSEWATYEPQVQRALLAASCQDASTGKMPGVWTLLHPETRLSTQDVEMICAAARKAEANTAAISSAR